MLCILNFSTAKQNIEIEIKEGSSISSVSYRVSKIFNSKSDFNESALQLFAKIFLIISKSKIHPGFYVFKRNETFLQGFNKIKKGESQPCIVKIIEGSIFNEALKTLYSSKCIKGKYAGEMKEGGIFPDTYFIEYGTDINNVIDIMSKKMQSELNKAMSLNRNPVIKTKSDLLILASIIEAEANSDDSRGLVSSVFTNRIKKRMKLGSDPTATYQTCLESGNLTHKCIFKKKVYHKDIEKKGLYNTYRINGLPIAPICLPGNKSIQAAAMPAESDYLFFISDLNGNFYYSSNFKEHVNKKIKLQKNHTLL